MSNIELQNRGYMSALLTRPVDRTKPVLGGFFWIDWDSQYFIFTGGLMDKGRTYTCTRCRQDDPAPISEPNIVELTIPHPITADIYYITCDQTDRHNMCCQESLDMEKKLGTNI